ncbi:MAG: Zn-dependent oligopeptidase [Elusimicrobiota bacterium]|nr:MAG: Zn-dependent oligopeptidase [Elusimicrobiota bacterium]
MKQLLLLALLPLSAAAAPFTPAPTLRYEPEPKELLEDCRAAKKRAESALEQIARLPASARTFDNTPWALDRVGAELSDATAADTFLKYVSISSSVRDAGNECETLLGQFSVEMFAREDLYRALKDYAAKGEALAGESKRLLDKQLLDFKRSGLELPKEKRDEVTALRKKLVELEASFGRNINEHKDYALFSAEELLGLPDDFVGRLERVDGKYKVGLDYPDYFPFMENSQNPEGRRLLEGKFNNRASVPNRPILKDVLDLRLKAARLLGYPTHAAFVLEDRMAKDPKTVAAFIARLRGKLKVLGGAELATLNHLKKVFEGEGADSTFRAWDWRFYDNQLKKAKYSIDSQKIKEYFPADLVAEQMLSVYQKLLGLKFRRIEDAALWHPDVKLYEVTDASGGEPISYFYMDLFPREGKYKHAAAFSLIGGRALLDGRYQKPVSAMVANFNKPTKDRPSLLTHDEVETFFHEFGHIMHQTLTKARYGRFAGSATARDFVEAPSQMLENWVWEADVLQSLSGHYQDRSKKLPKELLGRMLAAKNVNSGLIHLRQLLFGSVDQSYHGKPPSDTTAEYARLAKDVSMIPVSEGTHPEASFGHLMGYDAGYYGYMWSKVYAEDMFSKFKAEGVLNPALGRRYRVEILEKGSSRDEMESLKAFLGREPGEDAFLESIGLKPGKS